VKGVPHTHGKPRAVKVFLCLEVAPPIWNQSRLELALRALHVVAFYLLFIFF
jgi:hypothetical protein